MSISPNFPKMRYPTQYPDIVINFPRTLKEQFTRNKPDRITASLQ